MYLFIPDIISDMNLQLLEVSDVDA